MKIGLCSTLALVAAVTLPTTGALAQSQDSGSDTAPFLCLNGFTESDTDGDGLLSPQEISAIAENEFSQMDADGNDAISREEYVSCRNFLQNAEPAESDRSAENMGDADADGDGTVSQQEFMTAAQETHQDAQTGETDQMVLRRYIFVPAQQAEASEPAAMSPSEYMTRSVLMFIALDGNDDAGISQEEWQSTTSVKRDMSEVLNMNYDEMDTDGSGEVSREEYSAAQKAQADEAKQSAEDAGVANAEDVGPPVVYYRYESTM